MHGIPYKALKDHVADEHGPARWDDVRADAALPDRVYLAIQRYDEGELDSLAAAAATRTDTTPRALLERTGRATATMCIETYASRIDPAWDALDCLAAEGSVLSLAFEGDETTPAKSELQTWREDGTTRIAFRSPHRLCGFVEGIATGVGEAYDTPLSVHETRCSETEADHCEFVVTTSGDEGDASTREPDLFAEGGAPADEWTSVDP